MAAPDGTVWGSIVNGSSSGRKGRLGIYTKRTDTATQSTVNVQVWFWTIYSCSDSSNTLYYDAGTSVTSATTSRGAKTIKHTVNSGSGWSTSNQTKLFDWTYNPYNRGKTAVTYKVYAKLANIDILNSTVYANTSYTVPALASYTITYNANGGSGAPSSQTKWYGQALTLSGTKPTRTGYSFQGWATSASGSVSYASGANYTANAGTTLYAVWKANTYTITYNANGGSGAPSSHSKTYGVATTLSSTKPTRANYNFKGWATSASSTAVAYAPGASYTANTNLALYAVWELAYVKPRIFNLTADRCDEIGTLSDEGRQARIKFEWETDLQVSFVTIQYESEIDPNDHGSYSVTASGTSGTVSAIIANNANGLDQERTYTITVIVNDGQSTSANTTLNGSNFTIDAKAGGDGISFGKPAELGADDSLGGAGVADFAFDAKFNEPVYGNVMGLNRLPAIPANAELNDYMDTGCWAIYSNAVAATVTCGGKKLGTDNTVPPAKAGRFEVSSSTGEGIRSEQWSYLRQRFIPYNMDNSTWERDVSRGDDNVWRYYDWWRSTLTPTVSAKVYHDQKLLWGADLASGMYMTAGHTAPLTEKVSEQPNGIVLVFSAYENADDTNYGWQSFFVPKLLVSLSTSGHSFELSRGKHSRKGTKYLYIYDDRITGHADNNLAGTANGISYDNSKFVLRYVIGV